MQKARHFFTLPHGDISITLHLEIAFEKDMLYELHFMPMYPLMEDFAQSCANACEHGMKKHKIQNKKQENAKQNMQKEMGWVQQIEREENSSKMDPFASLVFVELAEYFMGRRTQFTISMKPKGTDFQQSVWNELMHIPYGATCSYKDIAMGIGNPKACRAVGLANNRNPIALLIPCHRVIGANGALMGYAGQVPVKAALLALEKQVKQNISIKDVNQL